MGTTRYDIQILQNASFSCTLRLFTDSLFTMPFDLSGYTVKSQAKETKTGTVRDLTISVEGSPVDGVITLFVPIEITAVISNGLYDVLIHKSDQVVRILQGRVVVDPGVTLR